MSHDGHLRGVQLRKHPRLSVSCPLTYFVEGEVVRREGCALEIGGGGMSKALSGSRPNGFELRRCREEPVSPPLIFETLPDDVRDAIVAHVNEAWRGAHEPHLGPPAAGVTPMRPPASKVV